MIMPLRKFFLKNVTPFINGSLPKNEQGSLTHKQITIVLIMAATQINTFNVFTLIDNMEVLAGATAPADWYRVFARYSFIYLLVTTRHEIVLHMKSLLKSD